MAAYIRNRKQYVSTYQPPKLVKVTGLLMYDDEHNGKADIETKVEYITEGNGFHHPWRSSAFEIHPIIKIEEVTSTTKPQPAPIEAEYVTLRRSLTLKRPPYGEATLQAGTRLQVVGREGDAIKIKYGDTSYSIPADAVR